VVWSWSAILHDNFSVIRYPKENAQTGGYPKVFQYDTRLLYDLLNNLYKLHVLSLVPMLAFVLQGSGRKSMCST